MSPADPTAPRPDSARLAEVKRRIAEKLPADRIKDAPEVTEVYGRDESDTGEYPPDLVVFPVTAGEVSWVFRACQGVGVPFTPCASRTGKSGGSLPLRGGVSVSLERMNRIRSISTEDLVAVAEPGVITGEFMRAVEEKGLFYPPDPNSLDSCSLGGNVAENAGGPRALKYGVTRDYVIGLEWVLPDGEVVRVGRQTIKGVAGYDLVGLFVGSEGTLGVATEITVQLLPLPKVVKTALLTFPTVVEAARAVSAVLAAGLLPRTLELLDDVSIRAVDGKGFRFPSEAGAAVLLEVDGSSEEAVLGELVEVAGRCEAMGALETLAAQSEDQRARLWGARRQVSTALRALKPFKISEDIVVPRSRIAEMIAYLKELGRELDLIVATYGHAGDGNLHANVLFDAPAQRPRVDRLVEKMLRRTVALGGSITGEHGVGHAKRQYLALEQPRSVIELQSRLKSFFDPAGWLNPGKMFPDSNPSFSREPHSKDK